MNTHSEAKKAKIKQPANHYKSPEEITTDTDLSDEEKRQRDGARRATSLKPARANVEAVPTKIFDELFDALVSIG